ncbi:hypothetical protein GCM10019059_42470 [Camelimonas fluminis]|nr:hypothetical protein GCM10019059_42470 [Camelimonas fluminis]
MRSYIKWTAILATTFLIGFVSAIAWVTYIDGKRRQAAWDKGPYTKAFCP